ncbi:MAG TPA: GAF domain-containing protein [Desulfatiglandales bacterium]|nr:GAF domain-containing protein [Desulfatiglandales bacterium]
MTTLDQELREGKGIGRRNEDFIMRDQVHQYKQIYNVGQIITSEMNMGVLFELIIDQTNQIMGTERGSVFLYDEKSAELWSLVATGMKKNEIRIPSDYGVAGSVFQSKTPLIINDAYNDPRFYAEVDKLSGFRTKNILCIPLINRKEHCIGSLQVLNKNSGDFTDKDIELLESISYYVAIALENSKLYEEVKNYSEELKNTLIHIETLEKVKSQLSKFVPSSVAKLAEQDPDKLTHEKIPMDVTILFIDIQGFSKITEDFDQRLVNDMVESHFSRYLECINRHGGEVNETAGDGLMVIFKDGPLESHAQKAVATGLEIISENSRSNNELSYPWGNVKLHIGANSGKAWVGSTKMKSLTGERWTYTASGLVTVLAARIGAMSGESRLYVGPETYQCIEHLCDCEFIGLQKVKNVKDPIPIYWVKNAKDNYFLKEK